MTTVLHVSDLHFGEPAVPVQIDAIEQLIEERGFDVVVISGDLSQRARPGEFQRARAFIREANKASRTIVVPGNHDVKWWRAPLGVGSRATRYANYRKYISPELEPVLRVPGVTFVGLNTAHGVMPYTLTWNVRDVGVVGALSRSQIECAREAFDRSPESDLRAIVMHHNPMRGELSQRHGLVHTRRVLGAFARLGVDLVMCGHDHQEAIHYVEHTRRGTVISTAGTVSNRSRGGRPSSINVIDLSPDEIVVTTHIWAGPENGFREGPVRRFAR
ncbi:MAG TPA: metallophosphoesterase [Gemmatimonadaceae bacterium]|nr:metallophosphoesterase [Gemmatimonadaceae bacterium]